MVTAILRELAAGPSASDIQSPPLPLLADLLTSDPVLQNTDESGGSIISLDFAHNLVEMLDAYGITIRQSMASLCNTLSTFFPNVAGIRVSVNGVPVVVSTAKANDILLREDFSDLLFDYATLYFASQDQKALVPSDRPIPYRHTSNPRMLLMELSKGPTELDSEPNLLPVIHGAPLSDTDMLGFSLSDDTLLVNFSPSFSSVDKSVSGSDERLLAYSLVNTLCLNERIKSVCFFRSGSQFDGPSGEIYWPGLFYPLPK